MPQNNIRENLEKALACHQTGNLKEAAITYLEILKNSPNHPEALHLLGVIAHQKGNDQEAIRLIERAIKKHPTAAPYYYNLAESQYAQGSFTKAAETYSKSLDLEPRNAAAWNRLGLIEQNHNFNLEAAKGAYINALKHKPNFPQALNNFGLLQLAQQDYNIAIKLFRKALTLRPHYTEATHNLALTLQHLGNVDEAAIYYQKTLEQAPDHPGVRRQFIQLLQHTCSWSELAQSLSDLDKITLKTLKHNKQPEESPFLHLTHSFDLGCNKAIAEEWSKSLIKT